mmetsp:Transcript_42230/g.103492  ORF Transcript_42230/g.103492 Transcript_42230/m.103492 type:complete len:329 (+) Transcript_42230:160-1146(+)
MLPNTKENKLRLTGWRSASTRTLRGSSGPPSMIQILKPITYMCVRPTCFDHGQSSKKECSVPNNTHGGIRLSTQLLTAWSPGSSLRAPVAAPHLSTLLSCVTRGQRIESWRAHRGVASVGNVLIRIPLLRHRELLHRIGCQDVVELGVALCMYMPAPVPPRPDAGLSELETAPLLLGRNFLRMPQRIHEPVIDRVVLRFQVQPGLEVLLIPEARRLEGETYYLVGLCAEDEGLALEAAEGVPSLPAARRRLQLLWLREDERGRVLLEQVVRVGLLQRLEAREGPGPRLRLRARERVVVDRGLVGREDVGEVALLVVAARRRRLAVRGG